MRVLVLGAGGIGGYYGARIHAAGGDVTFLVRPARARQLREKGLRVFSPFGDLQIAPKFVTKEELKETFDVIVLSCKAYDLDTAMEAIAPAVGVESVVLPLLNGVRHIDTLVSRFGAERVLGGVAQISVVLSPDGDVRHLNRVHRFIAGPLTPQPSKWLLPIAQLFSASGFDFQLSDNVGQSLWDKIVFLGTLAGSTCLMRASVGQIMDTVAGELFINTLLDECAGIAEACGHRLSDAVLATHRGTVTDRGSTLVASMLRDVERGGATEADHILGDMLVRAEAKGLHVPMLRLAYSHLQAYDNRRLAEGS